jgi:hypothetical protein
LAAQLWPKATINNMAAVKEVGSKSSNGVVGSKIAILVLRTALTLRGRDGGGSRNDAG